MMFTIYINNYILFQNIYFTGLGREKYHRKLPLKNTGDAQKKPDGTVLIKTHRVFFTVAPICSHTYPLMGPLFYNLLPPVHIF